jgi:hypothetical protein
MSKRTKREAAEFTELAESIEGFATSSLVVSVDYLQLLEAYGDEAKVWDILGKLKDLLG